MEKIRVLIEDTRIPGGSKQEIEQSYGLTVFEFEDGTFTVEGTRDQVEGYLEDYCIVVSEEEIIS